MLQGIYLLEEPLKLYRCEKASLYLGFSLNLPTPHSRTGTNKRRINITNKHSNRSESDNEFASSSDGLPTYCILF